MTKLKTRQEIPVNECWDLSRIFPNNEAYLKALNECTAAAAEFNQKFSGRISQFEQASEIYEAIKGFESITAKQWSVSTYCHLSYAADMSDPAMQKMAQDLQPKEAQVRANLSFVTSELAQAKPEVLAATAEQYPAYAIFLQDILNWQKHMFSAETEEVLAKISPSMHLPETLYETMKAADLRFPDFKVRGKKYPLGYSFYESNLCSDPDTKVRRKAFAAFSTELARYRNSNAACYNAQVQAEKTMATMRGFDSVYDYLLFEQKVDRKLFDRQIDVIMNDLAPLMRRYVKLLQKAHGLKKMHYADLKISLDHAFSPAVSIEDSKAYMADAMALMGEDYRARVMKAYPERWIDFAQNIGKSTGGFCTVTPEREPYILLNWSGDLDEVYTLAHELGHALQGILSIENNALLQADMTRYDVEAPSTFHEMLLTRSLLKQNKGPRFERWVLSSMIGHTYYHNCVTHLLEAAYQREVYDRVDRGESLQADTLDALYLSVLKKFWGDTIVYDKGCEMTWMRQPHYYMGLYSYVYSASLAISTSMYLRLENEGEACVADWMEFLKAGGPISPMERAKLAGIDISTDKPLKDSIAFIGRMLDRIEELNKELK